MSEIIHFYRLLNIGAKKIYPLLRRLRVVRGGKPNPCIFVLLRMRARTLWSEGLVNWLELTGSCHSSGSGKSAGSRLTAVHCATRRGS